MHPTTLPHHTYLLTHLPNKQKSHAELKIEGLLRSGEIVMYLNYRLSPVLCGKAHRVTA